MPVAMSIQWKPLRDSHYVVASLQPAGGGLRQIFARQSTLREIQALARGDPERPVVGLLLGERLDCSLTLTPYVLIESHVAVALASLDERAVSDAIRTLRGHVGQRNPVEVLGWYCSGRSAEATVSRTHAAVHATWFTERWQTVLTFGDGGNTGAFFLHDSRAARWFQAPFYELADSKAISRSPKPTCVAWPAYLTTASVVPLVDTPQPVPLPPPQALVAAPVSGPVSAPVSPPPGQRSVAFARPVVRPRRTPARDAIVGVGRAAVAARRSALDLAKTLGGRAVTASRHATERIVRIRAERAASAAQRKAEADAARAREEERRAKEAAERRATREEAQRRAAEAEKRRAAEAEARRAAEVEARRRAAEEAERRRAAEAEARRQAAEAEARRRAEEAEARRAAEAEAQRKAAEEAQRRAAEAEARRKAAEEAQRKAAEEEQRRAAEAEAQRQAAEAEAQRQAAEAEVKRQAAEAEARRQAAEAETRRLAEEAEAEAQRKAAEAEEDARRKAAEAEEDARRKAAEAEEDARRKAAEAEALRISVEVAAIRKRLARAPVEGSKRDAPKLSAAQMAELEDSTASDGPYRYLEFATREGFEVSERVQRGSPEHPETVWLLYESESGLRLVVVTTDEGVREASLHYNLHTEDDSLLRITAPEHRDLESRTIYCREECLHDLRSRCRRLRATGALERDWKVTPTFQHSVSPR